MPKLREANEELSAQPPSVMAEADIEHLSDPDGPYIQMDLACGIFEAKPKEQSESESESESEGESESERGEKAWEPCGGFKRKAERGAFGAPSHPLPHDCCGSSLYTAFRLGKG